MLKNGSECVNLSQQVIFNNLLLLYTLIYWYSPQEVRWLNVCGFICCLSENYGWRFVTMYRRKWSRPSPRKRNAERQNGSEEALQIAVKRREAKGKGEKEIHTQLNKESQRVTGRDKKAFLSDQCKEIEEN